MAIDQAQIAEIVENVLARLKNEGTLSPAAARAAGPAAVRLPGGGTDHAGGVFADMDEAIDAATKAHHALDDAPLETRKRMIRNIRQVLRENTRMLAEMAIQETGLGRVEDKILKNTLVINKTPGVEFLESISYTGDEGLTLIERAPYGVIGSITPTTNPTETIINNGIGMVSGGNAAVFNPHPAAKNVCAKCVNLINEAAVAAGGPPNTICMVADPTIESAQRLMRHKGVRLVVVTGGPGVVKEAMNSGKKVIAAGPGNPPIVIDETADLERAARGSIAGHSFDNNVICTDEKEVIVVDAVADRFKDLVPKYGAYMLPASQTKRLESVVTKDGHTNKKWVGKDAKEILKQIDVHVDGDPRTIFVEVDGEDHPFVQLELLMPVLPMVRARDAAEAIAMARRVEHNFRHTAVMYSRNIENLHAMARIADCSIFVKNAPNFAGLGYGGEGYTSFTIASPTGEGLTTVRNFTRERRCTLKEYFRIV